MEEVNNYLSVIFLSNILLMLLNYLILSNTFHWTNLKWRSYFSFYLFIGFQALYLLLKHLFVEKYWVYVIPFGLLYGPFFYSLFRAYYFNDTFKNRYLHIVPFIVTTFFSFVILLNSEWTSIYGNIYGIFLRFVTGVSYLYYALLTIYFKIKWSRTAVFSEKYNISLERAIIMLLIGAFLQIGHVANYKLLDQNAVFYSEFLEAFFMMVVAWFIADRLRSPDFKTQLQTIKEPVQFETDATVNVETTVANKYQKSKLDAEFIQDNVLKIEALDDSFFLNPDLKLENLAEELKITRYYLTQIFSLGFETNFNRYTNQKRLSFAVSLLLNPHSELTNEEIAFQSGFNSLRTFYRSFDLQFEMTPTKYKEIHLPK